MSSETEFGFGTRAILSGHHPEQWHMNQVIPPISLTTTYKQPEPGIPIGHDYSRAGNPTRDVLEKNLASLENAKHCRVFSSGLAATMSLSNILKTGDHILCSDDLYGGTGRYFRTISVEKHQKQISFVDLTNLENLRNGIRPNTKMVWFETPSNPLLKIVDIKAVVDEVKKINNDIIVVTDNTFLSPYFQKPLLFGADAVLHSLTKYINGHTDVIMGAVMTNNKKIDDHLFYMQLAIGAIASPFDCFLVIRSVKTLHLRMRAHMENAIAVAKYLEKSPYVEKLFYPWLESHPQHAIHKKQASGMSGMISFYIKGGLAEAKAFIANLKIFTLAESLGGCDSLIELPAMMTHTSVPADHRALLGITDNLVRLSVGCEDTTDIINDIDKALKAAIL